MGGRQYKSIKLSYTEQLLDNFLLYLMRQTAAFAREKEKRTEGTRKKNKTILYQCTYYTLWIRIPTIVRGPYGAICSDKCSGTGTSHNCRGSWSLTYSLCWNCTSAALLYIVYMLRYIRKMLLVLLGILEVTYCHYKLLSFTFYLCKLETYFWISLLHLL